MLKGKFLTTGIGSLPYLDAQKSTEKVCGEFNIPFWPQLPKRSFKENMYVQFSQGLPSLIIDEKNKKIHVDTSKDLSEGLGRIYEAYISGDYSSFGLTEEFAPGFYTFLDAAKKCKSEYVKGQLTGPVSFGLSIADEKGKAIIYNDTLKDALIKLLEMKTGWQIDKLKKVSKNIIIFIDEPYLASFGSSFVSIERHDIVLMLKALVDKVHSKGALAGVHCCGNTDWSIFVSAGFDIINFDAYSYIDSFLLYGSDILKFLEKGGYLALGIVPTSEAVLKETSESLSNRVSFCVNKLGRKKIPRELIIPNIILTPSCGLGTLSEELTEGIIKKLTETAKLAKEKLL